MYVMFEILFALTYDALKKTSTMRLLKINGN